MVKSKKSKFYFFRNFGWKLFFLSLIIAFGITYLLRESFYPYEFEIVQTAKEDLGYEIAYHDFDHDGFSEMMELRNSGPSRYNITVKNWNGGTIDQANYWEPIVTSGLMYADITGDGFDDILGFTQGGDSLYFYAHDLVSKKAIINKLFIGCLEEPISADRYATFFPICIADTSVYKNKVLIFAVRSFTALKPRSVYALDLEHRKIIADFNTNATLDFAFAFDLTGNGLKEIIIASMATGNVHYPAKYKDDKCWLFVLDQKLDLLFSPISYSKYPAALYCLPIEIFSQKYILTVPEYYGDKNLDNSIYLINSQGKVYLKEQNPFKKNQLSFVAYNPIVDEAKNPSVVYGWKKPNLVIKLNYHLKIEKSVTTEFENPRPRIIKDVNNDGKDEIFYMSDKYFLAFDEGLDLLAKFPFIDLETNISFRQTGPNEPIEISLQGLDKYYRLRLVKNKLSSYLPLIFIGLTGMIFLFLSGSYRLSSIIVRHTRFFKYLRYDSSDGILIINNQGTVIYFNDKIVQDLNLKYPLIKGKTAVSVLNHHPKMVEIVKNCMTSGNRVDQKIIIGDNETGTESEISVQPYKYILRKGFNYLVVIRSAGISLNSDKIHTWSRAVQKMAHDIKTPLSTVSLNLKVLQTRLGKIQLSEKEKIEISDDIKMMRTELDNIQVMTKNFLKFSNLDKPHFQAFNIQTVIEEAKNKFQAYITEDLVIEVIIDKDVKPIWADPQQIEMVFTILIENALAAVKGRGLININISPVQYLENIFSESLEIEVADTGPGIKEEDKKRIFEPYYSTKSEGTGMGLAIAKKIIEDNGGIIEVHSRQNFGAVFRFSLPVMKEEKNE